MIPLKDENPTNSKSYIRSLAFIFSFSIISDFENSEQ